jgi:molecular chaperone HscB
MQDPFTTLGIEARFDLDLKAVESRHRELSRTLHPDRYAGTPATERRLALGKAIEVNEAWRLVRDPIKRTEALLLRAGVAVGETHEPKPPPELLMEMMESREALAVAARKKDLAAIAKLADAMRARQEATLEAIAKAFDSAGNGAGLSQVVPKLGELRYIRRFLDEVSAMEEELVA